MLNKDRYLSIFYILLGITIVILASQIKTMFAVASEDTGPKFFPYLCGTAMSICGIGKFISSKNKKAKVFLKDKKDWLRLIAISAVLIGYVYLMNYFGYVITSFALLYVLSVMLADEKKLKWWQVAIFSAVVILVVYLLFHMVLNISLPQGKWIKALMRLFR